MAEHFIERMTWPEVGARIGAGVDAVLIPIGTTEQHGPPHAARHRLLHRPHARVPRGGARRAGGGLDPGRADAERDPLLVPHAVPGLRSASQTTTFFQVFREVCDSLAQHGFENLVAVNGHGGNAAALTVAVNHYFETTGRRVFLVQWWDLAADALVDVDGPMIHAEEAETSLAIALGQRVEMDLATRDAWDRGAAVREAGFQWTSFGQYGMRHAGPKVVVPMDMLRDITESGVVGDATRASAETGERIVDAIVPRIVQVCREMAGKE